ncbi:MAG: fructosamine kinase family protein [Aurantibacter sp.]
MEERLLNHLAHLLGVSILKATPVSGGDISQAFLLEGRTECFFCKVNYDPKAYEMFLAEKSGLEGIALTKIIAVPKVMLCEQWEVGGLLLMEYIEPHSPSSVDMELFGHQLAALHKHSEAEKFGWESDNFIGSLIQSNNRHPRWPNFYVQERLVPQLKLARNRSLLSIPEIPSEERLLKTCESLFPETAPSLLHGDLWSGNYLFSKKGAPYLIDPATYYGHHEVDIAMTRLFGGFGPSFYNAYQEQYPQVPGEKERNDLYQLYYLLVHLNLFGSSYKARVNRILKMYF